MKTLIPATARTVVAPTKKASKERKKTKEHTGTFKSAALAAAVVVPVEKKGKKENQQNADLKQKQQRKQQHVDAALVKKAIAALMKHHADTFDESKSLLGSNVPLQVQFGLEVAPGKAQTKPIRLTIPHALYKLTSTGSSSSGTSNSNSNSMDEEDTNDDSAWNDALEDPEVCFIVKDDSKQAVQDLIQQFPTHMGCIKKVLGLQSLRTKHAEFSQRRDLLNRFTVFLADDRILPMLTSALGKDFLRAKKQPIPVRMSRRGMTSLPHSIRRALSSTYLHIPEGTCITVRAGYISATATDTNKSSATTTTTAADKLVENVLHICDQVAGTHIPRHWANVRSISVKLPASTALPVYNKTPAELVEIATMAGLSSAWKSADEERAEAVQKKQAAAAAAAAEEEEKDGDRKKRKSASATSSSSKSPLLRALKKQKKAETEVEKESSSSPFTKDTKKERKPAAASSKNKRKQSIEETETKDAAKKVVSEEESSPVKKAKKDEKEPAEKKQKKDKAPVEKKQKKDDTATAQKRSEKADKPSAEAKAKKDVKASAETSKKSDSFIVAKKFTGSKKGYVFKNGDKGVGYYVDVKPVVDKAAMEAIARMQSRPKQQNGGGRKSAGGGGGKKRRGR